MPTCTFLSNLLGQNCSFSVISSVYYAIKWVNNINDFVDPTENGFVTNLLEAAKRLKSKPVKRKDETSSKMLIAVFDQYTDSPSLADLTCSYDLVMLYRVFKV